ncbi:hypothetical protein [Macrococcus brunensis]|uniref:hypothetical protein n=1 Tax=Macrococcus brunensis TaxID=198483 RepID=UPI001EF08CB5|nr:hypothetical protein [Macrococcus brunensis]ULG74237.1 hypothetical protein MGG13_00235 [Macrococcus brunensis]
MRVQFSVNDDEWKKLKNFAEKLNYPDVPSYCRGTALRDRTYADMWEDVKTSISKMSSGSTFILRDLLDAPPANLGVMLYNHQQELGIEKVSKNASKVNVFKKI